MASTEVIRGERRALIAPLPLTCPESRLGGQQMLAVAEGGRLDSNAASAKLMHKIRL